MKARENVTGSALVVSHCVERVRWSPFNGLERIKFSLLGVKPNGRKMNTGEEEEKWATVGSEVEHRVTLLVLNPSSDCCANQTAHHLIHCNAASKTVSLFSASHYSKFNNVPAYFVGQDSPVGIATCYRLDCPGIESRYGEIFRTCPDRPWDPPSFFCIWYLLFPGWGLTTHPI